MVKTKLFSLSIGDRFYFPRHKNKVYQIDRFEDKEGYEDWKKFEGYRTVVYKDDLENYFSKTRDFDVVFVRED